MNEMKLCRTCGKEFPATTEFFHKSGSSLKPDCKLCRNKKQKEYNKNNPQIQKKSWQKWASANREYLRTAARINYRKNIERAKFWHVTKTYGLTAEQFLRLYEIQKESCAICGQHIPLFNDGMVRKRHIDHCHKTGQVRGILCNSCNSVLGAFKDDPHMFRKAAEYIENPDRLMKMVEKSFIKESVR